MLSSARVLVAVQLFTLQPPLFLLRRARVPMHDAREKPMRSSALGRNSTRAPARALRPMHAVPPAARMREGWRKICPPLLLSSSLLPPSFFSSLWQGHGWQAEGDAVLAVLLMLHPAAGRAQSGPAGAAGSVAAGAAAACDRSLRPSVWPAQRGSAARGGRPGPRLPARARRPCRPAPAARTVYLWSRA